LDGRVRHEPAAAEPATAPARIVASPLPPQPAPATLLRLQREAGNRAVGGILRRRRLARQSVEPVAADPWSFSPSSDFTIPAATPALDVYPVTTFAYRAELRNFREAFVAYDKNCADAALQTFQKLTKKGLYMAKGRQPGLRTYDRTNPRVGTSGAIGEKQTELNWNEAKVRETVEYIKAKIDQGLPVFIGVNGAGTYQKISETTGRPINEGVTDHFLIIAGYTAEHMMPGMWPIAPGGWRVTKLQAIDNAIDDPVRSFPTFDVTRYSIRKPAWALDTRWAADKEYQLTQVRVYADDVEALKATSAWWN
jgi:hypothetical protein